jgi:hypothetical protein
MVQVLILNANLQLQSVFAVQLETTIPKSVAFTDSRDIYVFGLYDGNLSVPSLHNFHPILSTEQHETE